jgi:hypothetical protein
MGLYYPSISAKQTASRLKLLCVSITLLGTVNSYVGYFIGKKFALLNNFNY